MAVYHCHTHAISRSGKSGSALACAAYRSGEALRERQSSTAELAAYRTGEAVADGSGKVHDYTRKGGVAHTEIMLPEGVNAEWASDRATMWNATEAAEKRKNSRVAREWRVALPHELSADERVELARDFAREIVGRYGVAADVAVHAPSRSGDQRNWHAHILCTTREIADEGFGRKAVIEWSNTNLAKEGLPYTSLQIREMRMLWEEKTNEHLADAGHENRVDSRSYAERGIELEASRTVHVGQVYAEERDRQIGTERILPVERLGDEQSVRNAEAIEARPELLLDRITQSESVFTRADVAAALHRFVNDDWREFDRTLETVMASESLVCLEEGGRTADTGREVAAVFSTREIAEREARMLDRAERLSESRSGRISERAIGAAEKAVPYLSDEQRAAVRTIGEEGQLAVLRGVAGSGKTTALTAVREAAETDGSRIIGGSLSGKAARELEDGSGIESRTLASWERSWASGFNELARGDVFVLDEAGMVGSAQMGRIMEATERAGAKLVLVGDERQLQPIEAGAAFRNIKDRAVGSSTDEHGRRTGHVAELTEVRRQVDAWQREASQAFGRGEAGEALDAYHERGEVRLHDSTDLTRAAIVEDYFAQLDRANGIRPAGESEALGAEDKERPGTERTGTDHIVTAYRNVDVDALNVAIRGERVNRGELGQDMPFRTDQGERVFAEGDKVLLTQNDRTLGVANGDRGEVIGADMDRLDVRMRDGREVRLDASDYEGVRHGYAITTHRAQGMTVDRVHVMAGRGMNAELANVAMTRQRDGATLHASRDDFRDYATLRESVSRERQARGVGDYLPQRNALEAVRERIAETDERRQAQGTTEAVRSPVAERAIERADGSRITGERDERKDALRAMFAEQGMKAPETAEERTQRLRATFADAAPAEASERKRDRLRETFHEDAAEKRKDQSLTDHKETRFARLKALFSNSDRSDNRPTDRTNGKANDRGKDTGAER